MVFIAYLSKLFLQETSFEKEEKIQAFCKQY